MLRSELLKFKNTFGLYLILSFAVLEIITIPMYVSFVPNGFSLTNLAILSFFMLSAIDIIFVNFRD